MTLVLAGQFGDFDLIQQLEAPRLMPYQRMLMLFMAAFFGLIATYIPLLDLTALQHDINQDNWSNYNDLFGE